MVRMLRTQDEKSQLNLSFGFMGSVPLDQGMAFSSVEKKKIHMKVHTGERFDTLLLLFNSIHHQQELCITFLCNKSQET